mmetsp:Transcript_3663/g.7126  ORF Transcript_3663/g.7126 Transcript_3663/m.7126 type:complete len:240 (-) Transcript_3663:93-812(-)
MKVIEHTTTGCTVELSKGERLSFDFQCTEDALEPLFSGTSWGALIWDPSLVLTEFLDNKSETYLLNKAVVELGACCGVPGLACALRGARSVALTDLDGYFKTMQSSIHRNAATLGTRNIQAIELPWGLSTAQAFVAKHGTMDFVLAADCVSTDVYGRQSWIDLVDTLGVLTGASGTALICSLRRPGDGFDEFLGKVQKSFKYHRVLSAEASHELSKGLTMMPDNTYEIHEITNSPKWAD